MSLRYLLARLAGAQPDVLRRARTDRVKYTAMGGVLLTTAAVAGVSATFALNTTMGLRITTAAIVGFFWAVIIFNLDRLLIVSMSRQSGWVRNLIAAVPRLALAIVIGSIVSVPLVLRIFQPEINSELQVMHTENAISAQQKLKDQFADVDPMQQRVTLLQGLASGQDQPSVSADPDVAAAQKQVDAAQAAFNEAAAAAQCELVGSCGTGVPGVGEAYRQAKARADKAFAALNDAKAKLDEVTAAARNRIGGSAASNREAAQKELETLVPRLEKRKAERTEAQARLDRNEVNSEGLLARLEALDRLSAGHSNMAWANFGLFLLFMLIEVLPVVAKLLSMLGPPTLYDQMLATEENTLVTRAKNHDDVVLQIEQHRVAEQVRQGKEANTLLVDKQAEIAKKAIDVWGQIAMSRSDDELARWYARHTGQPAPATPAPAAAPAPPVPTAAPVSAPPYPAPVPGQRAAGGPQSYRQFKAQTGTPATNGYHPNP